MEDKNKEVEQHLPSWLYNNVINLAYLEEEMVRQFLPTNLSRIFNELIKRRRHYNTYILTIDNGNRDPRLKVDKDKSNKGVKGTG